MEKLQFVKDTVEKLQSHKWSSPIATAMSATASVMNGLSTFWGTCSGSRRFGPQGWNGDPESKPHIERFKEVRSLNTGGSAQP